MVDKTRLAKMQKMRGHTKTERKSKGTSMTKDEALKLALEYIETNAHERRHVRWAIKEALAQPEQEVAAFIAAEERKREERYGYFPKLHPSEYMDEPAQRTWVGLTDEEINACDPSEEFWGLHKIARAIEQRLKEKNA
jgi:hypothetical protein